MITQMQFLLLLLLQSISYSVCQSVQLQQGILRGTSQNVQGRTVFAFKGIPYAESPTGTNRFRRTIRHQGWTGTYLADSFKPPCAQPSGSPSTKESMSEDCLFLNVWTPQLPRRPQEARQMLPVVVFIEGQLFTLGDPSNVPAEDFVGSQDIVFVSLSYRLNAFGFLSLEDDVLPGNVGLWDQLLALEWVAANAAAFGGDRNSVTLMGHSGGAASVMFHVLSPRSNALFHRAIAMSGSVLSPWAMQPKARANALRLAKMLGCNADGEEDSRLVLGCLQSKRMTDIVAAVDDLIRGGNTSAIFAPNVDDFLGNGTFEGGGMMVPLQPEEALREGRFKHIPIMTGLVTDEGVIMAYYLKENIDSLSVSELGSFLEKTILPSVLRQLQTDPQTVDILIRAIRFQYFPQIAESSDKGIFFQQIVDFFTDIYFAAPLERQLRLTAEAGGNAHLYVNGFSSRDPQDIFGNTLSRVNASHGVDLLYLFGPTMYRKFLPESEEEDEVDDASGRAFEFPTFTQERLARNLKAIFGYFAARGEPIRNLNWDSYRTDSGAYFDLFHNTLGKGYREKAFQFWYEYLPLLEEQIVAYLQGAAVTTDAEIGPLTCTTYVTFTWLLLASVVVLIAVFLALLWMMRRATKSAEEDLDPSGGHSVFSVSGRSVEDVSYRRGLEGSLAKAGGMGGRWRESVMDYRL